MDKRFNRPAPKKLAILALLILGVMVLLGKSAQTISLLFKPYNLDLVLEAHQQTDTTLPKNYIYLSLNQNTEEADVAKNNLSIISVHPGDGRLVVLNVSDQIYLDLPKGFGYWRVGSVYSLGEEEKPPIGPFLLKQSLSKLINLPIDGIFISKDGQTSDNFISSLRQNPAKIATSLGSIRTDLTPFESMRLFWIISKIRTDKIQSIDMAQSAITESKLLPDSSRVLGINNVRLDTFVRENMADEIIKEENFSVAIFNATDHPGLAQEVSRIITNMGGSVIIINNTDQKESESLVILKPDKLDEIKKSYSSKRLSQVFSPKCQNTLCTTNNQRVNNSRADITVVIGEDYYKKWYQR